ncbi:TolC family protein [Carboxylicivirga sp. M1479]|uniref:TolC family protein n=1 Tax=Carboxylicivirga sp. M1479 TaxID=2594476 RepID=UPI001177690B|nr:TolC family protein [Carboxylicivirga sp. M1479]TRX65843.1 TolC family protein [Carboxylicivirga sp. M1479]
MKRACLNINTTKYRPFDASSIRPFKNMNIRMKSIIAITIVLVMAFNVQAQDSLKIEWQGQKKQWALLECITYAHENNITIKRQTINTQYQENLLKQSKLNRLPDLNASSDGSFSYGYTWVQESATNVDQDLRSFGISANTNLNVFSGLTNTNTIKRNKVNLLAAFQDMEKTKNDIGLLITGHYLQILFNKELLIVANEQYETSKLQVDRTKKLVDAGSQAMGSYLEIKSQAAKEALNVTQQENDLAISLLDLAQLLDLERPIEFDIEIPDLPELTAFTPAPPTDIYAVALDIMPEIKSATYNTESKEYDLKIAKGNYYPTLGIGAGMSTNANWLVGDPYDSNRPLNEQFKTNKNTYIGARLSIPIFGRLQTRNNVANAKLGVMDAQYELKAEKLALRKNIQQAFADAMAAYNKYLSSEEAVESFTESFRYTEKKFNVGLVNSVDYNVAKTDFIRAQSNLLQAKYEYILRTKILDFYKGIPLEL